ncbi:class I SAM-dependent methyltransferase [Nostoc sp.]|uniref:class I SAM-dependent methyltransferase n=1 Tax=Nostoc sp. TaxID=1180 RepID=UPI002FF6FCE0
MYYICANFHFNPQSATCFANYYEMLKSSGQQTASNVLKWAKLNPPPKRLLDVAGGPAEYSIAFCQKYPDLKADILDLPNAIEAGLPQIEQAGLGSRIQYIEGNLLDTDWGNNYDVVFLSNILHCLTAEQCEIALRKAFQALRVGGTVLINDLFHPGEQGKLSSPMSLFSLIYYVTCGGRIWPQPTILDWLTRLGFHQIRTGRYRLALLVSAEKLSAER